MEKFEKFHYQGRNYVIFEELWQLVTIIDGIAMWTMFESIKNIYNFETEENEVINVDLTNLIENARWKKYPKPSPDMIENINNAFGTSYIKEDFLH